jgi:hypothetical protein
LIVAAWTDRCAQDGILSAEEDGEPLRVGRVRDVCKEERVVPDRARAAPESRRQTSLVTRHAASKGVPAETHDQSKYREMVLAMPSSPAIQ